jgi:hypothetical protein
MIEAVLGYKTRASEFRHGMTEVVLGYKARASEFRSGTTEVVLGYKSRALRSSSASCEAALRSVRRIRLTWTTRVPTNGLSRAGGFERAMKKAASQGGLSQKLLLRI